MSFQWKHFVTGASVVALVAVALVLMGESQNSPQQRTQRATWNSSTVGNSLEGLSETWKTIEYVAAVYSATTTTTTTPPSTSTTSTETSPSNEDSSSTDPSPEVLESSASGVDWDGVAQCETGGDWSMTGSSYSGGVGFANSSWNAYGGQEFAELAGYATREQQIVVAERIREDNGGGLRGAWGCWEYGGLGY